MEEPTTNPLVVPLLFVLRCAVPLLILIGISYLLKRLGLISEPPPPPPEYRNGNNYEKNNSAEGDLAHGKP
jgi:hypothetical protein